MRYFVYIVECCDGTLYTGITNDLQKRIEVHNSGKGAKYTKGRTPVRLVYSEISSSHGEALRRELEIKRMTKAQKESLFESVPNHTIKIK